MEEFDENKAIACMRGALSEEVSATYSDDELLNLIDIIWDYYEQNGLLEVDLEDDDDDSDILDEVVEYAKRMIKKDKRAKLAIEHIAPLVKAEMDYEESILD